MLLLVVAAGKLLVAHVGSFRLGLQILWYQYESSMDTGNNLQYNLDIDNTGMQYDLDGIDNDSEVQPDDLDSTDAWQHPGKYPELY